MERWQLQPVKLWQSLAAEDAALSWVTASFIKPQALSCPSSLSFAHFWHLPKLDSHHHWSKFAPVRRPMQHFIFETFLPAWNCSSQAKLSCSPDSSWLENGVLLTWTVSRVRCGVMLLGSQMTRIWFADSLEIAPERHLSRPYCNCISSSCIPSNCSHLPSVALPMTSSPAHMRRLC